MQNAQFHQVVIIGGGFGGLYAAKALRRAPVRATLVDKRNFHLSQPGAVPLSRETGSSPWEEGRGTKGVLRDSSYGL